MKTITFRKLYKRMEEKDYGSNPHSIIVFEKRPHQYKAKVLSDVEMKERGYRVEMVTVQYQCFLMIDLWFVILRFDWLSNPK